MMGVNAMLYQYQRAFLAVALVALSALNRYHPPQVTLADERAELHRELELTPLRQRLTEMKAVGAVALTRTVAATAAGKQAVEVQPQHRTATASQRASQCRSC